MSWTELQVYFNDSTIIKDLEAEIENIRLDNARLQTELKNKEERNVEHKVWLAEKNQEILNKSGELALLKNELQRIYVQHNMMTSDRNTFEGKAISQSEEIKSLHEKLAETRSQYDILKNEIAKKLDSLEKLEKTLLIDVRDKNK